MQRYNPLPCLLKTVPSVSGRFLTLLFKIYVVKVNNKLILNRLWDHENNNKYGLLNTCEIKVAGYCLFCVFMDPDGVVVHEQAKKERTRISSHLDRTSLVSNIELVIRYKEQFFSLQGTAQDPKQTQSCLIGYAITALDLVHVTFSVC